MRLNSSPPISQEEPYEGDEDFAKRLCPSTENDIFNLVDSDDVDKLFEEVEKIKTDGSSTIKIPGSDVELIAYKVLQDSRIKRRGKAIYKAMHQWQPTNAWIPLLLDYIRFSFRSYPPRMQDAILYTYAQAESTFKLETIGYQCLPDNVTPKYISHGYAAGDPQRAFLVVEDAGRDLQEVAASKGPLEENFPICEELLETLTAFHKHKNEEEVRLVHTDVKPANFVYKKVKILGSEGYEISVKIIDFEWLAEEGKEYKRHQRPDTHEYISPASFYGDKVSQADDRYSAWLTMLSILDIYGASLMEKRRSADKSEYDRNLFNAVKEQFPDTKEFLEKFMTGTYVGGSDDFKERSLDTLKAMKAVDEKEFKEKVAVIKKKSKGW